MSVICKGCGLDNRQAAVYCGHCGQKVTGDINCPACESVNPANQNYCNTCGFRLISAPAQIQPTVEGAVGERAVQPPLAPAPMKTRAVPASKKPGDLPPRPAAVGPASAEGEFLVNRPLAQAAIALTVSLLAVTRFWGIDSTPSEVADVEQAFVRVAQQIETDGWIGLSHELVDWSATGYAYVLALWTAVAGDGIGAARLLSGIASVAAVGAVYLLVAELFNRRVALLSALLMSVGFWPLTYARLAAPMSLLLLLGALALYLFFRACGPGDRQPPHRTRLLALSGALLGVTVYLHPAAGLALAFAFLCLWGREYVSRAGDQDSLPSRFAAFAVSALIVSIPFFWFASLADDEARAVLTSTLVTNSARYRESDGVMDKLRYVTGSVIGAGRALVWSANADESGNRGRIVDPLTGLLAVTGLLVCISRWRQRSYASMLVLFIAFTVAVGLTRPEGVFGRLIIGAPVTFSLAGIAVHWALGWLKGRAGPGVVLAGLAILACGIILSNLTTYSAHPLGKHPSMWAGAAGWDSPHDRSAASGVR